MANEEPEVDQYDNPVTTPPGREDLLAPMVFDTAKPKSFPVTIDGVTYEARELSEAGHIEYERAASKYARLEDGVLTGLDGNAEARAVLLSQCLYVTAQVKGGSTVTQNVPLPTVKKWRTAVTKPLADRLRKLSGLDEEETEETLHRKIKQLQRKLRKIEDGKKSPDELPEGGPGRDDPKA